MYVDRVLKHKNVKFNSPDDFVDYKISVYKPESLVKITKAFEEFFDQVSEILKEDCVVAENSAPTQSNNV